MHGCLCSAVSKTRLPALQLPRPRMKHSPGPDTINSSLGQIFLLAGFFSSACLFVSNAVIDVWAGGGGSAERHKPQHLTNVQSAIELSFVFQGGRPQLSGGFAAGRSDVVNSSVAQRGPNFFFFFFLKMAYICTFPIPAFLIEAS